MQLFLVEPIKANVGLNSKPERAVAGINSKEGENRGCWVKATRGEYASRVRL